MNVNEEGLIFGFLIFSLIRVHLRSSFVSSMRGRIFNHGWTGMDTDEEIFSTADECRWTLMKRVLIIGFLIFSLTCVNLRSSAVEVLFV